MLKSEKLEGGNKELDLIQFVRNPYKFIAANPNLNLRYSLIPIGWVFQGLLYADKTERYFKILIDLVLTIIFYSIMANFMGNWIGLSFAFFLAHTLNWLFNTCFWGPFRGKYGFFIEGLVVPPQTNHIVALQKRIRGQKSIQYAAIYGSISRKENTGISDLDVRIIRKPGIINGFNACAYGFLERARAFLFRYPLDLYVIDSVEHLSKLRSDEAPLVLYDQNVLLER